MAVVRKNMEIAGWGSLCLEKLAARDPSRVTRRAQARPKYGEGAEHPENDKSGRKFVKI
jgi:hypothetical protein